MEMLRIFTRSVGVYLFLNQKQSIVCVFSLHILILCHSPFPLMLISLVLFHYLYLTVQNFRCYLLTKIIISMTG